MFEDNEMLCLYDDLRNEASMQQRCTLMGSRQPGISTKVGRAFCLCSSMLSHSWPNYMYELMAEYFNKGHTRNIMAHQWHPSLMAGSKLFQRYLSNEVYITKSP